MKLKTPKKNRINIQKLLKRIAFTYSILCSLALLFLHSCGIKKFIPEDERLYTGATLNMQLDSSVQSDVKGLKEVETELFNLIQPNPNTTFLGMKPALYFHYKRRKKNLDSFTDS